MTSYALSMIIKCWHDAQTDKTHLRVVRTDTATDVRVGNSSFLLRISVDEATQVERCFIRHIGSGREVYVQSGPGLQDFFQTCLLAGEPDLRGSTAGGASTAPLVDTVDDKERKA